MGYKILLVEDDEFISSALVDALEFEGYGVTHVENAKLAVDHLSSNRPDLILLDLMTPEMSGWQFLEEAKKHASWTMPIFVFSAASVGRDLDLKPAAEFIKKPVDLMRLLNKIEARLQKAS